MANVAIAELEAAARIFMQEPNVISIEQRQAAEAIIVNFRKSKSPYAICQEILEKSQVDLLLFEAADMLKTSLVIEWNDLTDADKLQLRQYLLNYILQRNLPPFVREKILQVVAIMIKRSSIIDVGTERRLILDEMQNMISSGNIQQQFLACRIIYAIMQEYVTTVKSDDTGLTFEEHFKAKKEFESFDLRKIFLIILGAFDEMWKILDLNNTDQIHLLFEFFSILEQILTWGFVSPLLPKRLIGVFEIINKSEQNPALRLPMQWARVFIHDEKVLELFFRMYWKVRELPQIQVKSLTCLIQLSSLNGPIVNNAENKLKYITRFLTYFLQLISSIQIKSVEAIGFATIFQKILIYSLPDNLSKEISMTFLQQLYLTTCNFAECAAYEEATGAEDPVYLDALDKIFEAWCLVNERKSFSTEILKEYATQIFNKYLQCHLSAPDGLRNTISQSLTSNAQLLNDEIDENEQDDCERFKEQLILIGTFGRERPGHSLPILCKLLENKISLLRTELQRIFTNALMSNNTNKSLEVIYEDIHWLLLIAAHVLSMESHGEQSLIPSDIMQYSIQQISAGITDIQISLKLLASPGQCISEFPNAETTSDPVIRLIACVFRLCEIENKAIESKMTSILSPEISSNIMWFLKMWAESYLLMQNQYYANISDSLKSAFGVNTPGGNWTVGFLLNKICVNVQNFYAEKTIVEKSIQLFLSLVKQKHKCSTVFNSEHFKRIIELRNLEIPKHSLIKGLTLAASCINNQDTREQYLNEIITPIRDNFHKLEWQQAMDGRNEQGKSMLAVRLVYILDEIRACNSGSTSETAIKIYNAFEPIFLKLPDLLNLFYNFQSIVVAVLELLCEILQNLLYLTTHKIYEVCMNVILVYVKHNANRVSIESSAEDDSMEGLMLLLKLISHLLSTNYFDLKETDNNPIDAAEVCIFGFQYIIPLITLDLLKYPDLCLKYYKTITLFVEAKSKKIPTLSPELLSNMLQSVELGLNSFGIDVQSTCFEFLQIMATIVYATQNPNTFIHTALMPFLRLIIEMVLTQKVGSDNKTDCAKALFVLICCYKDYYVRIIQMILQTAVTATATIKINTEHIERLSKEFTELTNNLDLINNRVGQNQFIDKFDKFIINIAFMF